MQVRATRDMRARLTPTEVNEVKSLEETSFKNIYL